MSTPENFYTLYEQVTDDHLTFFFISKGDRHIVKIIQYTFIQHLNGSNIYNLAFGDYDTDNKMLHDDSNSNNGDAYKVFSTILQTIPVFFMHYPDDVLMVQGSDSRPDFISQCRRTCHKRCGKECKNYNRRINIYSGYVNKNYDTLTLDYTFYGGKRTPEQQIIPENFQRYTKYDSVFVFKKSTNFSI